MYSSLPQLLPYSLPRDLLYSRTPSVLGPNTTREAEGTRYAREAHRNVLNRNTAKPTPHLDLFGRDPERGSAKPIFRRCQRRNLYDFRILCGNMNSYAVHGIAYRVCIHGLGDIVYQCFPTELDIPHTYTFFGHLTSVFPRGSLPSLHHATYCMVHACQVRFRIPHYTT